PMRASSSASGTGVAPGRVDSPPTSTIAQPCATMVLAWATAASATRKRPPSENESGVTFRMPMTAGRDAIRLRRPSRRAHWSARIGLVPGVRHLAVPARDAPLGMLVDPLGEIGLRAHGARAQRALPVVLEVLLLALARMRECADCHDDFDHSHAAPRVGGGSQPRIIRRSYPRYVINQPRVPIKISPLPSTAMSPAYRRSARARHAAARRLCGPTKFAIRLMATRAWVPQSTKVGDIASQSAP